MESREYGKRSLPDNRKVLPEAGIQLVSGERGNLKVIQTVFTGGFTREEKFSGREEHALRKPDSFGEKGILYE